MRKTVFLAFSAAAATLWGQIDEYAIKGVNFFTPNPVTVRASASYSDTNVGGPEWMRPYADGTCCSSLGPVRYHSQRFQVDASGAYDISSVQQDAWDGFIFVYHTSFDPLNQTINFVAGDDDGDGGIGTSDIDGLTLTAGTTYWLVTTGFANGDEGTFTNTVEGPGNIIFGDPVTIPTLGEWGMAIFQLALLAASVFMIRRQRLAT